MVGPGAGELLLLLGEPLVVEFRLPWVMAVEPPEVLLPAVGVMRVELEVRVAFDGRVALPRPVELLCSRWRRPEPPSHPSSRCGGMKEGRSVRGAPSSPCSASPELDPVPAAWLLLPSLLPLDPLSCAASAPMSYNAAYSSPSRVTRSARTYWVPPMSSVVPVLLSAAVGGPPTLAPLLVDACGCGCVTLGVPACGKVSARGTTPTRLYPSSLNDSMSCRLTRRDSWGGSSLGVPAAPSHKSSSSGSLRGAPASPLLLLLLLRDAATPSNRSLCNCRARGLRPARSPAHGPADMMVMPWH
mmetsp:Transcript_2691/g.6810  ORF Transcript_2691/g.6810 Transcript_2691/m.6810 type:complete len:300 (+) Transcript_2691:312-1211(+)